jgi:DNA polymerase-3 subunit gamma/tau
MIRNLTVLSIAPDGQALFDGPDEERAELIELAGKTEPARLRRMFRALVRDIEDLSWAPQPSAVLEMAIIRLATLPSGDDVSQLLSRLDQLERRLSAGTTAPSGGGHTSEGSKAAPEGGGETRSGKAAEKSSTAPAKSSKDQAEADAPTNGPGAGSAASGAATSSLGGGAPAAVLFDRFRAKALEADRAKFASLDHAQIVAIQGNTIALGVAGSFHADRLRARLDDLEALASRIFGSSIRISVEILEGNSAGEPNQDARDHSRRRRQQALNSEPVNLALEILEAEIVEIRPLGENH